MSDYMDNTIVNGKLTRTYDFNGEEHTISLEEFQAIEQSGKCSRDKYMFGEVQEVEKPKHVEREMQKRPTPIPVGVRPVEAQLPRYDFGRDLTKTDIKFMREYRYRCTMRVLSTVLGLSVDKVRTFCRKEQLIRCLNVDELRVDIQQLRREYERMDREVNVPPIVDLVTFDDALSAIEPKVAPSLLCYWVILGKVRGNYRKKTVRMGSLLAHIATR